MGDFCQNSVDECHNQKDRFLNSHYLFTMRSGFNAKTYIVLIFKSLKDFYNSSYFWIVFILTIPIVYVIVRSYIYFLVHRKELTQVGFNHLHDGSDRETRVLRAQMARRLGDKIPPPYPNGWYAVGESRDLGIGQVTAMDALGQNLCIYRGLTGKVFCVDAYCPHLGANMGVGGTVSGDCLECPFHKWKFDEVGTCISVPGLETAPKGVSIRHWTVVEVDGAIWVWYDAEGRPPTWEVTSLPCLNKWGYRGRNEFAVSAHVQEIPENGADVAHLNAVHSPSMITVLGKRYPRLYELFGHHKWTATWAAGEDHTANMTLTHDYKILMCSIFHIDVKITQIGPGHVRLVMRTPLGPIVVVQSVTPVGPLLQKVVHRMFSPWYNACFAMFFVKFEAIMFERDVAIWNNKRFVATPTYVKTDKTIRAFRTWFSQFYSENSVSYKDSHQNTLDW